VLDVSRVALDDSFFDLGGDSVSALRAAALMREELGVDLPAEAIFDHPILGDLAAKAEGARALG
jgi:acyl carrier protein